LFLDYLADNYFLPVLLLLWRRVYLKQDGRALLPVEIVYLSF
jgi:hypothetical protein